MNLYRSTPTSGLDQLPSSRISNQLELDILEIHNEDFEGIIEFTHDLKLLKGDSFSQSLLELDGDSNSIENPSNLRRSPRFLKIWNNFAELNQNPDAFDNYTEIELDGVTFDVLLNRLDVNHYACRFRRHSERHDLNTSTHYQQSPLVSAGIMLWSMDEHTHVVKLNSPPLSFIESVGTSGSHSIFDWIRRIHPDDQNRFQSKFETFLNGFFGFFHHRYRIVNDTGTYEQITTIARRARPTTTATVVTINGVHLSDSPIDDSNDELRLLSHLARKIRIPISITDTTGKSLWTNASFNNLIGCNHHELKERPLLESLSGPLTAKLSLEQYANALTQSESFSVEAISYASNGDPIWVNYFAKSMLNSNGKSKRFITFVCDVSDYKKTDSAFLKNEEKFRSLFENAADSLLVISLKDGNISESNASAKKLFDCSSLLGTSIETLTTSSDRFSIKKFREGLKEEKLYSERIKLTVKGKNHYTVDLLVNRLNVSSNDSVLVTIRDVTDELFLEEKLLHSQKMQAVGKLAGGVAHDFNNLLSGIRGFAELIENSNEISDTNRIYLKELLKTSDRASTLTGRLLSFSRQRSDTPKVCDLNDVVNNLSPMLSRILQQDIYFKITIGPNCCHSLVDAPQIEQVIMNLVVNAQEATSGSSRFIELRTYSKTLTEEMRYSTGLANVGNYNVLEVIDNGYGMSPEVVERIFEPFFTTKKDAGTGLGLAITYSIVNKCGGFANIESSPGNGTRFSLIFPRVSESSETAQVSEVKKDIPFSRSNHLRTILIAEDQDSLREILQISLGKVGHKLIVAKDGQEALDLYKKYKDEIELVLTDSIMPNMVGSELARSIREINRDERIVIMSGLPEEELFKDVEPVKIDAFVNKPFSIKDVIELVERLLAKELA